MKRRIITFILTAVIALAFGISTAGAMGLYEWDINISYNNAPENTAFVDILFKKAENDIYAPNKDSSDSREQDFCRLVSLENEKIELDDNCGLAKYDDGFTSCMMRRYFVSYNKSSENKSTLRFPQPSNAYNQDVFNYYGEFKVAYCDKKGNVLAVTDPVKVKRRSNCVYEVYANGTKAGYTVEKDLSGYIVPFIFIIITLPPVLMISAVVNAAIKSRKRKALPEGQEETEVKGNFLLVFLVVGAIAVFAVLTVFT